MQLAILLLALATISQAFPRHSRNSTAYPDFGEAETRPSFKPTTTTVSHIYQEADDGQLFDIARKSTSDLLLKANTASLNPQKYGNNGGGFIKGWSSTAMQILWDINLVRAGSMRVLIGVANDRGNSGSTVAVSIGNVSVTGQTIFSGGWNQVVEIDFGNLEIAQPGKYTVTVQAKSIRGAYAGDLSYVLLRGSAIEGATEVLIPRRADSIHLWWNEVDAGGFKTVYNAIQVVDTIPGTYFMVNGFDGGYFGMQDNDYNGRRTVHFSIWDTNDGHPIDPNQVNEEDRVVLVEKAPDVEASRFGNEGTGMKTSFQYSWKVGKIYHFIMRTIKLEKAIQYSAYFYLEEKDEWKKMAVLRIKNENPHLLRGLYSFVEDYIGDRGRYPRTAIFGPAWAEQTNGNYKKLTRAGFTQAGTLKNTDSGLQQDGRVYLKTGGTTVQTAKPGTDFNLPKTGQIPNALAKFINDVK